MKKLVSIIITTYGRKFETIERSIKSAKKQTYDNIEIILVDDNKNNSIFRKNIEKNIKKYPEIVYLKHENNMGAQIARNDGIRHSKGYFLAFLDDDDEWVESKIEKQVKIYKDGIGLIYSMGYCFDEKSNKMYNYVTTNSFKKEAKFNDLLYGDCIGTTTQALIPKYVIEDLNGFDINQPARQDYEMWLRISKKYKCCGIPEPLFIHYIHSGEQISKSNIKSIIGLENIYKKYKKDYNKNYIASWHILFLLANCYLKNHKIIYSFKYYIKSFYYFVIAFILNHKELLNVLKEHNKKSRL